MASSDGKVFAVGHFPPPVHGMAVATARFADDLVAFGSEVVRLDISGRSLQRDPAHHALRVARALRAAGMMLRRASRGDAVYLGSDAGLGMLYTLLIALTARGAGLRLFVHHHSYAYIHKRMALMAALVRATGRSAVHVFSCDAQAAQFRAHYGRALGVDVLPIAYVLDDLPSIEGPSEAKHRPFKLGHMGNLTVEKGLRIAFETLRAAQAAGLPVELVVAGPTPAAEDAHLLTVELDQSTGTTYLGAVHGEAKERFFASIDAFVFPSRYRHESFGIVAAEAMAHGVPVIAYRAGCLDTEWVGGGGLVLEPQEDFAAAAVEQLRRWIEHPATYGRARAAARRQAEAGREAARASAARLANRISGGRHDAEAAQEV
ncbi:MAG: glycosyltransferase family 4 protein [Acidimicrobiales bacterium]